MKRFEYITNTEFMEMKTKSKMKLTDFCNKLGQEGWDICTTNGGWFIAKREIEEPVQQRQPKREMEYSR